MTPIISEPKFEPKVDLIHTKVHKLRDWVWQKEVFDQSV